MAKKGVTFVCGSCGAESAAWAGRCHVCGEWNTLEEVKNITVSGTVSSSNSNLDIQKIKEVSTKTEDRISLNYGDVNRVLGGGIVKGSALLLAGEPGIGKSTLLLQLCGHVEKSSKVLYISGEESAHQVGLRAKRLGINQANVDITSSTITDDIAGEIMKKNYQLVIVDSIQTLQCKQVATSPGSVSQINSSSHLLLSAAKASNTAVIIVGHVTKEGTIAGPKVLEHIVDGVFQLEGDRYGGFKVLRAVKNRFGSTNETALFEMKELGLEPVLNPSEALLHERQAIDGSVVLATMEGSRPLLVEVQALVNTTSFGYPKRTVSGIDIARLNVLAAMLEKRTKLNLHDKDIYVNIVGGIKVQEPAADLAICLAIGSAAKALKLQDKAVVFGEVGLSGEVRHVPFAEQRLKEAKKLGFKIAIGPVSKDKSSISGLQSVTDVKSALNKYLVK